MLNIRGLKRKYSIRIKQHRLDGARGYVTKDKDGYLILVDDRLDEKIAERTIDHEALHIIMGHLDERNDLSSETKEHEVDSFLTALYG